VAGDVKQQEMPGLSPLSPWDVLVWKVDSLDKRLDVIEQGLNRRLDRVEGRMDRLEEELRGTRQSVMILQFTAVLGFTAMLVSMWVLR
jgi:hypothetical protein